MLPHDTYLWPGFGSKAAKLHVSKQGIDSPERLRVLINKNVNYVSNVMRKPGSKNAMEHMTGGNRFQSYLKKA